MDLFVAVSSHIKFSTKSNTTTLLERLKIHLKYLSGSRFQIQANASMTSVRIHCTARNLTLPASEGKSTPNTAISESR